MKELFFKGLKIFEFNDDDGIQIIGNNTYHISLIIDLFTKVFSGYRYSDIDISAMNGYYPEVRENGKTLSKKDINVIKLSYLSDVIDQLTLKKNSILMKNVLMLRDNLNISNIISKIEEALIELSIDIDDLLKSKLSTDELSIKGDVDNVNFDKIVDSFINMNFTKKDSDERIPTWLLNENQSIDLLINLVELAIESGDNITIIFDRLDSKLENKNYHKLIETLYNLTINNSNFNIWIIPSSKEGVLLDYNMFENTFIIDKEIFKLGNFETTYESICRNYPSHNIPSYEEVLRALLQYYPFHNPRNIYHQTRELVIMSVFMELLGENMDINTASNGLTNLEKNFLTKIN